METYIVRLIRSGKPDVFGTIINGQISIDVDESIRSIVENNAFAALGMMRCRGSVASTHMDHGLEVRVERTRVFI